VDSTKAMLAAKLRIVAQNPLYRVGRLPASRCKEPAIRPTSVANVRKYYAAYILCLDKVWKPVVEKAGFTFESPRLDIFTGKTRTACDVQDSAAYCGNGVISMNATFDIDNYRKYNNASVAFISISTALLLLAAAYFVFDRLRDTLAEEV